MKRMTGALVLLAFVVPARAAQKEKPQEPFYRRYLIPGNPLDEKIKEQEKRVQANPKSADLHNDFGNLLAARRFPKEARRQYETAMNLDRSHFLAAYNLGLLYETEGQISRAISAYEKSVDRNRGFPPSRFRLGRLYEKRGWDRWAIEQYARALTVDPSMRDPRRNPLVVDTRLLYRVSLESYPRDLATASMASEAVYVEERRLRRVPVDRALWSDDLSESAAAEPATPPAPAPTPVGAPPAPAPNLAPYTGPGRPPYLGGSDPLPAPTPTPPRKD